MGANEIILGDGVFSINGTDIALTRGGGKFSIEREYRQIEADGDYGAVKGRIRKIKSTPKLVLKALELLPSNMTSFYPALSLDTADSGKDVLTAAANLVDGDYKTVAFTGRTNAGKQVYIEVQNAVNLENIDWDLVDKDEIVPELTYTGAYLDNARTTEPWKIEFAKGTTYTATFTITSDGSTPIEGASVIFHNQTISTSALGVAAFTGVEVGTNMAFTVTKGGYEIYEGAVDVDGAETVTITMTAI